MRNIYPVLCVLLIIGVSYADDTNTTEIEYKKRSEQTFLVENYKTLIDLKAPPSPNIQVSSIIPKTFAKTPKLNIQQKEKFDVIINIKNIADKVNTKFEVQAIAGYISSTLDPDNVYQSLNPKYYENIELKESNEINLVFNIVPFSTIEPEEYLLILKVFYTDSEYEYSSTALRQHFLVLAVEESTAISGIFSVILLFGILGLGAYFLINWLVNRFVYKGSKKYQFDLYQFAKEKIKKNKTQ